MQLEEEERKQKEAENTAGWLEQGSEGQVMDQPPPQQLNVSDLKPTEMKYQVQNDNPCDSQTTELDAESPK